jgi:hypothetical protein
MSYFLCESFYLFTCLIVLLVSHVSNLFLSSSMQLLNNFSNTIQMKVIRMNESAGAPAFSFTYLMFFRLFFYVSASSPNLEGAQSSVSFYGSCLLGFQTNYFIFLIIK